MEKEEKVLFPLIKYLVETEKFGERPKTRNYGTVKNPIKQMLSEHETALEIIEKIKNVLTETGKELSDSFFPLITEFETDLHQHIYLENIVLFPRAIELENKLLHN
jgi:regulator of cell morphogenesis and NO signaling